MDDYEKFNAIAFAWPPDQKWMLDCVYTVDFDQQGAVDWRSYVPQALKECWSYLSAESRLVIISMCHDQHERNLERNDT